MSTHAQTFIYTLEDKKPCVSLFTHYDGYPSGWGVKLVKDLLSKRKVNTQIRCQVTQLLLKLAVEDKNRMYYDNIIPVSVNYLGYRYHLYLRQNSNRLVVKDYDNKVIFDEIVTKETIKKLAEMP